MKQARRKELKTNELRLFLQETYESIQRNSNYVLIGLSAVVVVLAIGFFIRHRLHARTQEAWSTYHEVQTKDVIAEPEVLEQVRGLAAKYTGDSDLGPLALQLEGDMAYSLAASLTDPKDEQRRIELFKQAREAYRTLITEYPKRSEVQRRARNSLAAVDESLIIIAKPDAAEATELANEAKAAYRYLVDNKPNAFAEMAAQQLSTFDERVRPIKIVETQPAPAATQPAIAPAATAPAAAATAPAK